MELENYICNSCGKSHETCICIELEEDYFYGYMEYLSNKHCEFEQNKNKYPKFIENDVEVSEGIIVSKEVYNKYYK